MQLTVQLLGTLGAAFGGTFVAFLLEFLRKKSSERKTQVAAGNRALFVLGNYLNELLVFEKTAITPVRDNSFRHILMRPLQDIRHIQVQFNFLDLDFLVDKDRAELLQKLLTAESSYRTVIAAINERSKLHINSVQPSLEKAGVDGNTAFTVEYVTEVIGDRLNITLESLTEEIIEITDSQIVELKSLIEEFRMAMKEDFPKGKFLGYKLKKKD